MGIFIVVDGNINNNHNNNDNNTTAPIITNRSVFGCLGCCLSREIAPLSGCFTGHLHAMHGTQAQTAASIFSSAICCKRGQSISAAATNRQHIHANRTLGWSDAVYGALQYVFVCVCIVLPINDVMVMTSYGTNEAHFARSLRYNLFIHKSPFFFCAVCCRCRLPQPLSVMFTVKERQCRR